MVEADTGVMGDAAPAEWVMVLVETDLAVYEGRVHLKEAERLLDVLCDDRPFVHLKDVSINDSDNLEDSVAINKAFIRTVQVLHGGKADLVPLQGALAATCVNSSR